jgi:hypothetical protein
MSALLPVKRSAEVSGWEEPYAGIALAFLLYLTFQRFVSSRRDARSAIWLGVCWGAALYISFALFAVFVGLILVDLVSHRSLRVLRDVCLTSLALAVVISPWLLRNRRELGGWTLMRDNLGLELRYSNHDHVRASATLINLDPASANLHPSNSVHEAMVVREMGELNYNRREFGLALGWMMEHPGEFARLSLLRFFYFWFGPLEHPYELIVTSGYTLLGLVGLGRMRKKVGEVQLRLWCTVLLFYPVLYYFVQYSNRYRVPIDWMIWLSAGLLVSGRLERETPAPSRVH